MTEGASGAEADAAVLDVFEGGSPDVANAHVDITKTYTNAYVEKAKPVTLD